MNIWIQIAEFTYFDFWNLQKYLLIWNFTYFSYGFHQFYEIFLSKDISFQKHFTPLHVEGHIQDKMFFSLIMRVLLKDKCK